MDGPVPFAYTLPAGGSLHLRSHTGHLLDFAAFSCLVPALPVAPLFRCDDGYYLPPDAGLLLHLLNTGSGG